jgi:predicted house-cleaning NTP pyrophosphatase (Maf/HAM1 superfamily)
VEIFPVTTWSAAFSPAYPYGMTLVARINGSFTGFTHGLPMEILIPLLRRSGIAVMP